MKRIETMSSPILIEQRGAVALVILNRPEKLNALDAALIDRLLAVLDDIEADDGLRAIVLTGVGERAFSAGADIAALRPIAARGAEAALRDFVRRGQHLTSRIERFPKPIIAAVNGLAYGGGCEILEATHLALASAQATFCKAEINLGIPPVFGGTQRLPRLIGRKRALAMILSAEPIDAIEAQRVGLVNAVVPREALIAEAIAWAQKLAGKSPLALAACLHAVTRGLNVSIDEGLAIEASAFARLVGTADMANGITAWIERRAAR
jgi:enoyl-CoA hydratase